MSSSATSKQDMSSPAVSTLGAKARQGDVAPLIDFLDLKAQFAIIRDEVMAAVTRVMESQQFILGNEVRELEEEIAAMLGAKHAIACASGSDALVLALLAAEIGPGDEVITTPFTFVATAGSIARVGAKPVFVDIDPHNFNIDPEKIKSAMTPRTRAIMPVHLFGLSAEMKPIIEVAQAQGIGVIEDAAQAIKAIYHGRQVGTIGACGCFSFFPSKNLGGAGDGGLLTVEDPALAERLRLMRVHGSKKKYHHEVLGTNSRLDALQAAVLRVKLRHLEGWTAAREDRADRYRKMFGEFGLNEYIAVPPEPPPGSRHVYNQFSIRCSKRDQLREFMRRAGVPSEIYYPVPLHLQPAFAYLGHKSGDFPNAEAASQEVLALPVYPELRESQQQVVVGVIADFYGQRN